MAATLPSRGWTSCSRICSGSPTDFLTELGDSLSSLLSSDTEAPLPVVGTVKLIRMISSAANVTPSDSDLMAGDAGVKESDRREDPSSVVKENLAELKVKDEATVTAAEAVRQIAAAAGSSEPKMRTIEGDSTTKRGDGRSGKEGRIGWAKRSRVAGSSTEASFSSFLFDHNQP